MRPKKILFTDLDATLLSDDGNITERNRTAIRQLLDEGNYIVIATGRPVESARIVIKKLGLSLPGCFMMAFNGAVLYDCSADRILFQRTIPVQDVYHLFHKAREAGLYIQTYSKQGVLTERKGPELEFYQEVSKLSAKIVANIHSGLSEEPHKVMLIDLKDAKRLHQFYEENKDWTSGRMNEIFSTEYFLEYVPLGVHKGVGVEQFCKFLNIPLSNTIAVGNEKNDIPMLEKARVGAAVKNAVKELKDVANYQADSDNNQDAVAEVIQRFIL